MAKKFINAWGDMMLALKEGREVVPDSLLASLMAMPHAELAKTTMKAVERIAELKALTAAHQAGIEAHERINAINKEILSLMPQYLAEEQSRRNANLRWSRLDGVKDWAFKERGDNPKGSRASFLTDTRMATIKAMAEAKGVKLSGSDEAVKATVTRWFREAGIK